MQFDYSTTATRPAWLDLPPVVRNAIELELAEPVDHSAIAGGGFTPGSPAVLNHRWFAKAAPSSIPWMYRSYFREAEVAALLPKALPMPEFRGAARVDRAEDRWQLVFFRAVSGRMPAGLGADDPARRPRWAGWVVMLACMLHAGGQAEVPGSPALGERQRFSARMLLGWLIERRTLG